MTNKVLIVGGSGYLGNHLYPILEQLGYDVHFTGQESIQQLNYYQMDFSDTYSFQSLKGKCFDIIFLLASKLDALGTNILDHPDLKTNSIYYGQFLQFIANHKLTSKIVYISSMTIYDKHNISPVKENGKLSPFHTYGLSKLLAENITSYFCKNNNINGVILRIPGLYGENRKSGFIYNTIQKLKNGDNIAINTKGLGYWETINVKDLCLMLSEFLKIYQWNKLINIYNFSYGEETDFYATAHFIGQKLNCETNITYDPEKGYIPFYLSNEKLRKLINIDCDYYSTLENFIYSI